MSFLSQWFHPMTGLHLFGDGPNQLGVISAQKDQLELLLNLTPIQKEGPNGIFWFYVLVAVIAVIGLALFGAFIVYDLKKTHDKMKEDREKYITAKHKELDQVGNDKSSGRKSSGSGSGSGSASGHSGSSKDSDNKSVRSEIHVSPKESKDGSKESTPKISAVDPNKKTVSGV